MVDENIRFSGDAGSLINAYERIIDTNLRTAKTSQDVINKFREMTDITRVAQTSFNRLGGQVKIIDSEYNKLTVSFRRNRDANGEVIEGFRVASARIDKNVESLRKLEDANQRAARAAKEAANLQRRQSRETQAVGALFRGRNDTTGATLQEQQRLANGVARLKNLVRESLTEVRSSERVTAATVKRILSELESGTVKFYQGRRAVAQRVLAEILLSEKNLGAEARRESEKRAANAERAYARIRRASRRSADQQQRDVQRLTLSWQSYFRLFATQLAQRGFSQFLIQIRDGVSSALEFSKAVGSIRTIDQAGLSTQFWADQLGRLSDSFGLDTIAQAEAAYFALSNQVVRGSESLLFLEQANRIAITGLTDQTGAVNLLSSVLNSYNLEATEAADISAQLFKALELGRFRVGDIANTIGRLTVPAAQLGVEFDELSTFLAVVTRNGLNTSESLTQIRNVLVKILKPTEAFNEILRQNGFESGVAATQALGLLGTFELIAEETNLLPDQIAKVFNTIRALGGGLTAVNSTTGRFAEALAQVQSSAESFDEKVSIALGTTGRQVDILQQRLRTFFINDLGQDILTNINDFVRRFGGDDGLINLFRTLTDVVGGAAIAYGAYRVATFRAGLATTQFTSNTLFLRRSLIALTGSATGARVALGTLQATATGGLSLLATALGGLLVDRLIFAEDALSRINREAEDFRNILLEAAQRGTKQFNDQLKDLRDRGDEANKEIRRIVAEVRSLNTELERSEDQTFVRLGDAASLASGAITDALESSAQAATDQVDRLSKLLTDIPAQTAQATNVLQNILEASRRDAEEETSSIIERTIANIEARQIESFQLLDPQDAEAFKANTDEIVKGFQELARIGDQIDKTNERNAEERIKLSEREAKIREDAAEKIADLEEKARRTSRDTAAALEKARRSRPEDVSLRETKAAEKLRDIQEDINRVNEERDRQLAELREQESELVDETFDRLTFEKLITQEIERRASLQDEALERAREEQEAARREAALRAQINREASGIQTRLANLSFADIRGAGSTQELEDIRNLLTTDLARLQQLSGSAQLGREDLFAQFGDELIDPNQAQQQLVDAFLRAIDRQESTIDQSLALQQLQNELKNAREEQKNLNEINKSLIDTTIQLRTSFETLPGLAEILTERFLERAGTNFLTRSPRNLAVRPFLESALAGDTSDVARRREDFLTIGRNILPQGDLQNLLSTGAALANFSTLLDPILEGNATQEQLTVAISDLNRIIADALPARDPGETAEAAFARLSQGEQGVLGQLQGALALLERQRDLLVQGGPTSIQSDERIASVRERQLALEAQIAEAQKELLGTTAQFNNLEQQKVTILERQQQIVTSLDTITSNIESTLNRIREARANGPTPQRFGGRRYQFGGLGTDNIPALLQPGEFVVRKQQARQLVGQLIPFNDGSSQRFNNGGSVTNIGDVHVHSSATNVDSLARDLRKGIKQGRYKL